MIELESVYVATNATRVLYNLLKERKPYQSISHKAMPTLMKHAQFVHSTPYLAWYLIQEYNDLGYKTVGSIYLTEQREIGIFVFGKYQGEGHASLALNLLMELHPGKFLANINPNNEASLRFFEKFGAKHIQNTYEL